jgi:hypothetical protein
VQAGELGELGGKLTPSAGDLQIFGSLISSRAAANGVEFRVLQRFLKLFCLFGEEEDRDRCFPCVPIISIFSRNVERIALTGIWSAVDSAVRPPKLLYFFFFFFEKKKKKIERKWKPFTDYKAADMLDLHHTRERGKDKRGWILKDERTTHYNFYGDP